MFVIALLATTCALFWAFGYAVLNKLADDVNQFTIDVIYGIIMALVNIFVVICTGKSDNFLVFAENPKLLGWLVLYVAIFLSASFIAMYTFLEASKQGISSAFVSISSIYPVFNFIISYMFFNQTSINWKLAAPGIFCGFLSILLISFAKMR